MRDIEAGRHFAKRVAGALLCAAVSMSTISVAAPAQAQQTRGIDIPAQPLDSALLAWIEATGNQLVADGVLTAGKRSAAVSAETSPAAALSRLLSGTGLAFRQTGPRMYRLERAPRASEGDAIQLGAVRVESGAGAAGGYDSSVTSDPNATEGTGAYTGSRTSTATRLPLTVQETPQSVTVVTRQRMDDFQMQSMEAVLLNVVGISDQRTESDRGNFASRGAVITNLQIDGFASPYLGSASRGRTPTIDFDSYLYDRIEVVRGATGLLSATGDPSATINMVRKKPGREFAFSGFATVGSRDHYRGGIDLSVPIRADGAVRARMIGLYQEGDSWRVRASDNRLVLSGMLEFDLSPTTLLRVTNAYQDGTSRGPSYGSLPQYFSDGTRLDMPRSTNLATTWSRWDKSDNRTEVTLEQQIGERWKVVAMLARARATSDPNVYYLGDGTPDRAGNGRSFWYYDADGRTTQWTYDAHLNGSFDLFGREHMLMLGVNGYRTRDWRAFGGSEPLDVSGVDTNIFTFTGIAPKPARIGPRDTFSTTRHKMDGIFGSLRLSLADPLHVILGGRMTDWRGSDRYVGPGYDDLAEIKPRKAFTPFFGATFDIVPQVTLYASYADLFTPQAERDADNRIIDPIVGSNKEIGLKAALLDGRLTINAALYETLQDNVAEMILPEILLPDGSNAYRSLGKGNKTRGYEIEVNGAVTSRWNVYAGLSRNRTTHPEWGLTNTDTPRYDIKTQTTWRVPALQDRLTVGGGVNWQSRAWYDCDWCLDDGSILRTEQKAFALVNLMARFDVNERISLSLNANNLFDKHYYTWASFGYYGEPRSVLFTANARF